MRRSINMSRDEAYKATLEAINEAEIYKKIYIRNKIIETTKKGLFSTTFLYHTEINDEEIEILKNDGFSIIIIENQEPNFNKGNVIVSWDPVITK